MSELSQYTLIQLRIACRYGRSAIAHGSARVARRLQREQSGQDVLEYAGMVVLVAAVIALLFTLNVPSTVGTAIAHAANSIVSNGSSTYTPPKAIQDPTKP
jgi:Flp pilus assembly pilin Flp